MTDLLVVSAQPSVVSRQSSVLSRQWYIPPMPTADRITVWMRRLAQEAGARGFVVGLSGGVDSAVVARLAQLAMPGSALGVIMPCHSQPQDEADARLVAERFSLPTVFVDLAPAHDALLADARAAVAGAGPGSGFEPDGRAPLALANIKPRLRMTTLYFVANSLNYLVAGTGNRSEIAIGYYTKYGDGGVDLLPLGRLFKSEVRALARELGVPAAVVEKAPSAGLWRGQTDEVEMGCTYEELERFLTRGADAVAPQVAARIAALVRASEHKRELPPMPEEA
jgi:NAD+ synthase